MSEEKKLTLEQKKEQDKKLSALSLRIHRNEVFTSLQVHKHDLSSIPMIFLPLSLMDNTESRK